MLEGVGTAIVTPFKKAQSSDEDPEIDWESLEKLIEFQIANKVAFIVPCGTTGESPTLTHDEKKAVIYRTVKQVNGRVKVMAGTGNNCTRESIEMTRYAEACGADMALVVTPYYNKPSKDMLRKHFSRIADSTELPIVLYNIAARCVVNIETDTLMQLADECPNIIGVKEASGNLAQIQDVINQAPNGFYTLSGDDSLTLKVIKMGGRGIISVASNIVPDKVVQMVQYALNARAAEQLGLDADYSAADRLDEELSPLYQACFIDKIPNPVPIKYMLSLQGRCEESYRGPLFPIESPESRRKIEKVMVDMGLYQR